MRAARVHQCSGPYVQARSCSHSHTSLDCASIKGSSLSIGRHGAASLCWYVNSCLCSILDQLNKQVTFFKVLHFLLLVTMFCIHEFDYLLICLLKGVINASDASGRILVASDSKVSFLEPISFERQARALAK
jgi:hypothetical protein